jgi:hypothetical protein
MTDNTLSQTGGDNSTNYQALGDITVNTGIQQQDLEKILKSIVAKKASGDDLIVNHYVCEDYENLYEIESRDYTRFPLTNVRFLNNEVMKGLSEIIHHHGKAERSAVIRGENFSSVEKYLAKHNDVTFPRETSSPFKYYEVLRNLELPELESLASKDGLLKLMLADRLHERSKVAIAVGYEHGCWEIPLMEEFIVRRLWGVFTAITNSSDQPIIIQSLEVGYRTNTGFDLLLGDEENRILSFPQVLLPPNATVVIPTSIVLPPIGPISRRTLSSHRGEDGDRVQILQHDSISIDNNDTFVFGDTISINTINYKKGSSPLSSPVHKLDFNNLLTYDMHWQIGSCPHLFTKGNDFRYVREILPHCQNTIGTDTFLVPPNVNELIICELEDEVTIIESIHVNQCIFATKLFLNKGDVLNIPVKNGDVVIFKGQYIPIGISNKKNSQSLKRAEVVHDFHLENA